MAETLQFLCIGAGFVLGGLTVIIQLGAVTMGLWSAYKRGNRGKEGRKA